MSDTLTLKRIVDLVTQADIDSSVYTIIDSVTGAVKKYPIGSLICSIAPIFDATAAYAAGKYCNYNGQLYQFDEAHAAGSWTGSDATAVTLSEFLEAIGADVDDLKEALTDINGVLPTKADKDGTVASAEQLLSDVGTEDKQPYLFRATPYDSTRVDEEVVGCSVGWNQLVGLDHLPSDSALYSSSTYTANGVTFTKNSDGSVSVVTDSGGATANTAVKISDGYLAPTVKDHTHLIICQGGSEQTCFINYVTSRNIYSASILSKTMGNFNMWLRVTSGSVFTTAVKVYPMVIDLETWFGKAIADYALSLETATPGSGVAWIKQFLPGGYIPYSAPTLKSVSGLSGHKFTGFNQWDEEWELGAFDGSGAPVSGQNSIRSKNFIQVVPNTTYYYKNDSNISTSFFCYDAEKTFMQRTSYVINQTFVIPDGCHYLKMGLSTSYGNTYKNDICINLSDPAKNGQYAPYEQHTYPLDSSLTLRGILKMDAGHNVYADGDVYKSDGTVTRIYGIAVIDEDTPIMYSGFTAPGQVQYDTRIFQYGESKYNANNPPIRCDTYYPVYVPGMSSSEAYVSVYRESSINRFIFRDPRFGDTITNVTEWKAWLASHPITIIYELITPFADEALPYASPQNCEPGGTEEYVYAEGGSGVPVGHDSKYLKNMRSELERVSVAVPDAPSSNGTYTLKATVSSGAVTYAWVSD